jgi:SAM-dependent methyltransferase
MFDLVTFWDTLEHLPNPREALSKARESARPSGWLALTVPNPDSVEARLFGQCWAGWDIPRHLWWPSPEGLSRLLNETGWAVQEAICLRGRQWLLARSIQLWLEASGLPVRLRNGIVVAARSWPAKVLLWPYFLVVERLKRGSILAVFAKRKD